MQLILMMTMIINTIMFHKMKHPMSMGMTLLIQTILISIYSGVISKTFWFSYILFLIFIGGMLILFIYMSSLSPNEKMKFFMNSNKMIIFILLMTFFNDKYFILQINEQSSMTYKNSLMESNLIMLSKMYDTPNNTMTTLMISYLLLTLIIIVKITNLFNGPLRMKN